MIANDLYGAGRITQPLFILNQRRSADINHSEQEGGGEGRKINVAERAARRS
jgi:hypothetical protein